MMKTLTTLSLAAALWFGTVLIGSSDETQPVATEPQTTVMSQDDTPTVAEVIDRTVSEAERALRRTGGLT